MTEIIREEEYERIIAVGDLHGCYSPLVDLMRVISVTADDLIIFIGDYIDRGPESKQIVDELITILQGPGDIRCLKGNHEDMLLGAAGYKAAVRDLDTWLYNGGTSTLESYGADPADIRRILYTRDREEQEFAIRDIVPKSHLEFFQALDLYIETENYFFCHAGVNPLVSIEEGKRNMQDILWMRSHLNASRLIWKKTVVCGHTPLIKPLVTQKLICIDTGLYYYGTLTAIDVLSRRLFQVKNR